MPDHELVTPSDPTEWKAYHDIRRQVLLEARGEFGTYDENHPDERAVGNHPKLLTAILRRVAIRADAQRHGRGRIRPTVEAG
jgi:sirohydrochlorin ferrochelatase